MVEDSLKAALQLLLRLVEVDVLIRNTSPKMTVANLSMHAQITFVTKTKPRKKSNKKLMKNNKGLLAKKIDLKGAQINGGKLARTFSSCSTYTGSAGCSDSVTTMTNDQGKVLSQTTSTW